MRIVNNAFTTSCRFSGSGSMYAVSFCNRFCWVRGFIGVSLGIVGIQIRHDFQCHKASQYIPSASV